MINRYSTSSKIIDLIKCTKAYEINWVNMAYLKSYLKRDDIKLNDITNLRSLLLHLQKERFIFDCNNTYIVNDENYIYVFSKSKYSENYRLDLCSLNNVGSSSQWKRVMVPINWLLRLRNAIEITNEDDDSECSEFLASISLKSSHI